MKISKILQSNSVTFCDIECPQCSRVAKLLDYFVDNQEEITCPQCGYNSITNRENNETKIEYGHGVLYIEFYNKPFIYYIFDTPPNDKDIKDYLEMFNDELIIKEKSLSLGIHVDEQKFLSKYKKQTQ